MEDNMKIDFVVLWLDDSDENWIKERDSYRENSTKNENVRFRDWDLLKYWFRSIEKNASWVNNIYLITYGHLPKWLNVANPKLKIVKHSDFIPKEYLPTFNSNVIEMNLFRIESLSERFVLFNDDVYLFNNVEEKDFFEKNKVKDVFVENPIAATYDPYNYTQYNNMAIINKEYKKNEFRKDKNYYNFKYGKRSLVSKIESKHELFVGFLNQHITQPYFKSSFEKIWNKYYDACNETCLTKFRKNNNISHYAVRYMQMLDGKFLARDINFGKSFELSDNNEMLYKQFEKTKYKVICINDSNPNIDFEKVKKELVLLFDKKFPNKSQFEK